MTVDVQADEGVAVQLLSASTTRAKLVEAPPAKVRVTVITFPEMATPAGGTCDGTLRLAGTVRTSEVIAGAEAAA